MRVLVCGGRNFTDRALMEKTLYSMFDVDDTVTLIHGNANGADIMSAEVLSRYFRGGFRVEAYEPDWKTHGKAAGPIRNQRMLDEGRPDLVVAFPGGRGTGDMVRRARAANIKVTEVS